MRLRRFWLTALPLLIASCGDCVSIGYPAFVATVRDATTQESLIVGATVLAFGAGGADSVTYTSETPTTATSIVLWEGNFNEGIYTVEVRRPGYATWRRESVVLRTDGCGHPEEAVDLSALLSREE